jgi:gamma-glutamylcyclotransferase
MSNTKKDVFIYFAYGSNMLTCRIKSSERAPSAKCIGIGYVQEHRLTFDKVSSDGSGKCDLELTNNPKDKVHGVLFEIENKDKDNLDRAEGVGNGYEKKSVEVVTASGQFLATTYVAIKKDNTVQPYHWYKAIVVTGAVEHGLPNGYIEWLRTFYSKNDSDKVRRSKNESILFTS